MKGRPVSVGHDLQSQFYVAKIRLEPTQTMQRSFPRGRLGTQPVRTYWLPTEHAFGGSEVSPLMSAALRQESLSCRTRRTVPWPAKRGPGSALTADGNSAYRKTEDDDGYAGTHPSDKGTL